MIIKPLHSILVILTLVCSLSSAAGMVSVSQIVNELKAAPADENLVIKILQFQGSLTGEDMSQAIEQVRGVRNGSYPNGQVFRVGFGELYFPNGKAVIQGWGNLHYPTGSKIFGTEGWSSEIKIYRPNGQAIDNPNAVAVEWPPRLTSSNPPAFSPSAPAAQPSPWFSPNQPTSVASPGTAVMSPSKAQLYDEVNKLVQSAQNASAARIQQIGGQINSLVTNYMINHSEMTVEEMTALKNDILGKMKSLTSLIR